MNNSHYISDLGDIEFNLFSLFEVEKFLLTNPEMEMDREVVVSILAEVERLAQEDLALSFSDSIFAEPELDNATGEVRLAAEFKEAFGKYLAGGWNEIGIAKELGGVQAPRTLQWAINELLVGANPALYLYITMMSFANMLYEEGNELQQKWAKIMFSKNWCATMMLTEAEAGSDVGAGRCKAMAKEDGSWSLTGSKRFITSGEHDLSENIIHLVLARPQGAKEGSKGLSLFIVPKFMINEDGSLGRRNGVYASGLESKMGIKYSATCEMQLGEKEECIGFLLGDKHEGIKQMFKIIENARMMVGVKAIATLSTAYLNALKYSQERVQGFRISDIGRTQGEVTIIEHLQVKEDLVFMKAMSEGLRSLIMFTASIQDRISVEPSNLDYISLNDFLLPVLKGYGSETAYRLIGEKALSIFGGSGYTKDWPLEQYLRDAKIDTLYEGTTNIQANDLFFRKIVKDQGRGLYALLEMFNRRESIPVEVSVEFEEFKIGVKAYKGLVEEMVGLVLNSAEDNALLDNVVSKTNKLLNYSGELILCWLLLESYFVAKDLNLDGKRISSKLLNVRVFHQLVMRKFSKEIELLVGENKFSEQLRGYTFDNNI